MNILLISADFPIPANNGHRLRNWAMLRGLVMEGHAVSLLTFVQPGEPSPSSMAAVRQICRDVDTIPITLPKSSIVREYANAGRALVSSIPYSALRFRSSAMESRLRLYLKSRRFDCVMCETCYPLVNFPGDLDGLPLVLDNHNLEHVLVQRYARCALNPARRSYAELEWRKLRHWERLAWKRAQLVLLCSQHDDRICKALSPGTETAVIPNVIDVESYMPESAGEGTTILYVGGMDWLPNRDAVHFFALKILPEVRKSLSQARFVVAGRSPGSAFERQFRALNISFTGTVADIKPVLARADICVVPLRIGSGTRLKILEAAAMGKAIVSTRIGAEGLEFVPGEEILLADDPKEFARTVIHLLVDEELRRRLGAAAARRVESQYSIDSLRAAVRAALSSVMAVTG